MTDVWPSVSLGDHAEILTGFPFKSADYCGSTDGVRLLRGDNLVQRAFRWDGVKYWPAARLSEVGMYVLRPADVVLAMDRPWIEAGLKVAALRSSDCPALLVQRVARLRSREELDQGFLKWLLYSQQFTDHVLAVQTGSAVPHISGGQIRDFRFSLPPLGEQRSIARVLGVLDDLIAVNLHIRDTLDQAGAALLADMLYRFPDPLVVPLQEAASVIESGRRPVGGVRGVHEGVPSVGAESIDGLGVFDFSKTRYVPAEFAAGMRTGIVQSRDVLVYKDGGKPGDFRPHVGMFGDGFPFDHLTINEHVYRVRAAAPFTEPYLYFWLTTEQSMDAMRRLGTGAAIPGLNSTALRSIPVVVPPRTVQSQLLLALEALVGEALACAAEARRLAQARDELLPLLLSRRVHVDELVPAATSDPAGVA